MTCCFVGHRKIEDKEIVKIRVKAVVEGLIVEKNVREFYFGSHSEFNDICHAIVTDFQKEFPDIIRIHYSRRSEYTVKKEEKEEWERWWSNALKKKVVCNDFEGNKLSDRVYNAGKASYIERNQEMIDDSEYCVFFYKEGYKPEKDSRYNSSGKSGTKIAYEYALRKKKIIINIAK